MLAIAAAAVAAVLAQPMLPVPFDKVHLEGPIWKRRIETNHRVTVPYDFEQCERTGRIANFARAGGLEEGPFQGIFFNDSDVYKVIEGAAYCLAQSPDPQLDAYLDDLIAKIAAAQEPDGYLYTIRTIAQRRGEPVTDPGAGPERWSNLGSSHELYNVGHLYEAAAAHFRATGKRTLLDVAIRNADLVCRVFGPGPEQRPDVPGHQEIELGLLRLHDVTEDPRYLEQARWFLNARGLRNGGRELYGAYAQDHEPVSKQTEAVGHAVRAGYMYAAMAEVAARTRDVGLANAAKALWADVVERKLYVTGGIGASRAGEAFGAPYHLPNASAYNETCAAIANALWNWRMFLLDPDAKYLDVLERTVYNGFLAGVALSGDRFFYPNPLACDGAAGFNHGDRGRAPWFDCSCCPVNVVRFVPSMPGMFYATSGQENLYVCNYGASTAEFDVGGLPVKVQQLTDYPWDGAVTLRIDPDRSRKMSVRLRIPGWAEARPVPGGLYRYGDTERNRWTVRVNNSPVAYDRERGFAVITRTWHPGEMLTLVMRMPVRRAVADDRVEANRGRVAVERGPIVYCVEGVDHDGRVDDLVLGADVALRPAWEPGLLGGCYALEGEAGRAVRAADGSVALEPAPLRAVPYHLWAHREPGAMAVWLPTDASLARVPPAPTTASRARASASHCWASDTVDALNDQRAPASSGDHDLPRHTWWDRRGTTEWVQYDLAEPARVRGVEVYWFDDTGVGSCRIPARWRVLHRVGDAWVSLGDGEGWRDARRDAFDRAEFAPVETAALRIEAELQPGFSGGVLEWRIVDGD